MTPRCDVVQLVEITNNNLNRPPPAARSESGSGTAGAPTPSNDVAVEVKRWLMLERSLNP